MFNKLIGNLVGNLFNVLLQFFVLNVESSTAK